MNLTIRNTNIDGLYITSRTIIVTRPILAAQSISTADGQVTSLTLSTSATTSLDWPGIMPWGAREKQTRKKVT